MKERNKNVNDPLFKDLTPEQIYFKILKDKNINKILNYKCRYIINEIEDVKSELVCRVLENPEKKWSIYNLSNEINKIISPIITANKYKSTSTEDDSPLEVTNHDIKHNNVSIIKHYTMEFSDLNRILPKLKKILKKEEFLLFKYVYIDGETIKHIKDTSGLSNSVINYIHNNLKDKLREFFKDEEYLKILKNN